MTTDPFTEAARAEAERRWSRDQADGRPLPAYARMNRRIGFDLGARWAAAQEPTDAERAVRELHTPRDEQVITGDCATEECDHEDRCPTVPHPVCTECSRIAEEGTPYYAENGIEFVSYPCRTIRTLDAALSAARAARRDEEKR